MSGVYQVNIDAEQQKVAVSGSVDSATLIKKPKRSILKGLEALKNQQKLPVAFGSEEDDDYFDDDDDDEDDEEEDELGFLGPRLGLLRQQIEASNAKKNIGSMAATPNNGNNMNNVGNGNAQKKGTPNPNQNMGMKVNPGEIDQQAMAALKMNSTQLGGGNINSGEGKRANDIATMMNLAGFNGNVGNIPNSATATRLGCNPNGLGGFQQVQSNMGYQGSSGGEFPSGLYAAGQHPSATMMNMNGYNHPAAAASMMMNMQNRHIMQQQQQPPQPQMMYHRSPFIPPNTGYYYNYSPAPCTEQPNYSIGNSAATHMFSDENTSSCSIM
ncbi:hypothetical protein GH714_005875 [Hevea brasiliensis]|uniref:HMA domain-containing protein n=1 Tax=Hevea brasiliensis TaxID=3981 RepID=A0A6A6NFR7_HEVBR|nr:hypothetical protein GH714_005875 [Hevea brasiliensis]